MENLEVIFTEEQIQSRIKELAEELYKVYGDEEVVFVCTLKGAVFFACDLLKRYKGDALLEFVKISSYSGEESTGRIQMSLNISEENIKEKNVVILEDIIDTGRSLKYLYDYINLMHPKSLATCALLDKKMKRVVDFDADYVGFETDDLFVIGYGLDYNQKYRQLPYIGAKIKQKDHIMYN